LMRMFRTPGFGKKINENLNPESVKKVPIRSMPFRRWLAAAAIILVAGLTVVLYYSIHQNKNTDLAGTNPLHIDSNNHLPAVSLPADTSTQTAKNEIMVPQKINTGKQEPVNSSKELPETGQNKEMFYYAKLIELKHEELKTLEKDEPLLYRQFSGDVQKLDSVYHSLKTQLPNNSNREQVIEAMISNLQLQIGLLNKQLDIIKKIKHTKKSAYEKAYKSV